MLCLYSKLALTSRRMRQISPSDEVRTLLPNVVTAKTVKKTQIKGTRAFLDETGLGQHVRL